MTSQWTRRRLKSPALRLFTQPFIQTQTKENFKAPRQWPLWGEFTVDRRIPAERASYAEKVSIWWRHHDKYNHNKTKHNKNVRSEYVLDMLQFIAWGWLIDKSDLCRHCDRRKSDNPYSNLPDWYNPALIPNPSLAGIWTCCRNMVTSWYGIAFHYAGFWGGESTPGFPAQNVINTEHWWSISCRTEQAVEQTAGRGSLYVISGKISHFEKQIWSDILYLR